MFGSKLLSSLLLAATFAIGALAHEDTIDDVANREVHALWARDSFSKCKRDFLEDLEMHEDRLRKREELVAKFVKENNIQRRNTTPYTKRGIHPRQNQPSCVLTPQTTLGPYWIKSTIRDDNRESQPGIPMILDVQFVDVTTCRPVTDLYVDLWGANATGIYGGVSDYNTVGQTWLRGLAPTDSNGIVHMTTIFPGWYDNRAVHTHILAHRGGRVSADGKTYSGGRVPHIGQLFWDMNLIRQIGQLYPYNQNRMTLLDNNRDFIFMQASRGYNALMQTELIGSRIEEGILASITIGIRPDNHNPDTGFPGLPNPTSR